MQIEALDRCDCHFAIAVIVNTSYLLFTLFLDSDARYIDDATASSMHFAMPASKATLLFTMH